MQNDIGNLNNIEFVQTRSVFGGIFKFIEKPTLPATSNLSVYLNSIANDSGRVCKKSFNPMVLKKDLSNTYMLKVIDGGKDFLVTVHGTHAAEIIGKDLTNCLVSDIPDAQWRVPYFRRVIETGETLIFHSFMGDPSKTNHVMLEIGYFPLCAEDGLISHIIVSFDLMDGKISDYVSEEDYQDIISEFSKFHENKSA